VTGTDQTPSPNVNQEGSDLSRSTRLSTSRHTRHVGVPDSTYLSPGEMTTSVSNDIDDRASQSTGVHIEASKTRDIIGDPGLVSSPSSEIIVNADETSQRIKVCERYYSMTRPRAYPHSTQRLTCHMLSYFSPSISFSRL
jgi:hypothetical protein